ncbi:MAG: 4Fe-4S binding protein [bacterium]
MSRRGNGRRSQPQSSIGFLGNILGGKADATPRSGGRGRCVQQRRRCGQQAIRHGFEVQAVDPIREAVPGRTHSAVVPAAGNTAVAAPMPQVQAPKACVDIERCVACGACVDVCPVKAIDIQDNHAVVNDGCIGCGMCVAECPNGAFSFE